MKNQLQSVNLIAQFDNGLCLEIRNIYVEDTNNIAKIREEPMKLFNLLLPSIPLYFNLDRDNYLKVSRDLYKEFVNQIVDLGYQKCISTKDNFSFIKEFNPLVKSEEDLIKLRTDLISAYDSKDLSEALTEHLKDSIKTFFSKFEVSSLADKEYITSSDILNIPLICSSQTMVSNKIAGWLNQNFTQLNIVANYNLIYNASIMVQENLGSALCLANLVNTNGTNLCFKPLYPPLEAQIDLVWKKHQILTKPAQLFLQNLQEYLLHNK